LLRRVVVKEEVSMNKIVTVSSVVALAALAGCGSDPVKPAPAAAVGTPAPIEARPGFGRVESVAASPSRRDDAAS
jgi:hypothetical protein